MEESGIECPSAFIFHFLFSSRPRMPSSILHSSREASAVRAALGPTGSRLLVQTDSPRWLIDKILFNLCLPALDPAHSLFIWVLKSHWAVWSICLWIYRLLIFLWSSCFMYAFPCVGEKSFLPPPLGYLLTHNAHWLCRTPQCRTNFISINNVLILYCY